MQETTTRKTTQSIVPLDFVLKTIKGYLFQNNYPQKAERLIVVKNMFDKKTRFKDIKPLLAQPSQYDEVYIDDFFTNYISSPYFQAIVVKNKKAKASGLFYEILYEISTYLLKWRKSECDEYTPSILTDYKDQEYNKYNVQVERILNDKEATLNRLEKYHMDNMFVSNSEQQSLLKKLYFIPEKSIKNGVVNWQEINRMLMEEIKSKYDLLDKTQQQLVDTIKYIDNKIKNEDGNMNNWSKRQLYKIIKNLEIQLQSSYISSDQSPKQIGRSANKQVNRFQGNEEFWANEITKNFDFTNPKHNSGLIVNFFDLHEKHKHNVDNPIYSILQDFILHIDKIKLSDKHKKIVHTYMYFSSDKKEVAKRLNTDTELMNKMLNRTISKKIAKYFNNVGN